MFRRSDELVSNYQIKGTALDCDNNGEVLAVAGGYMVNLVGLHGSGVAHLREKCPCGVARMVRFHHKYSFFCVATPNSLDFFHETRCFNRIYQNGKVLDFDFNVQNDNLVVSSTTNSVSIFDVREPRKPSVTLSTIFGSQQAKFSKFDQYQVISAHGCDLRFWDIRNSSAPKRQIMAHEGRIVALEMNPTKPNVMITSAMEDTFKVWNRYDEIDTSQVVLLSHDRVGKVIYSPSGDEFISISVPETASDVNTVKLWKAPTYENPQELRKGLKDTYADACWHKGVTGPYKYLFTLGKNSRLLRNPITGNGLNDTPNEMPVPIVQSAEDRKRDKQLLGTSQLRRKGDNSVDDDNSMTHRTPSWTLFTDEWSGWVRAPNQDGGDLLSELGSLRKVNAVGLTTSEVNFQRAAIGFNYSHRARCKRITIEMRFHKQFLENGWIYMEVVQKDSPLDADLAKKLLQLIQEESRNQTQAGGPSTVMARVLEQLPVIVEKLNVFTDAMDIQSSKTTVTSTDSSMTEDTASHTVEPPDYGMRFFPISYGPAVYDNLVPAPRLCGARFNTNGILCTFGKLTQIPVEGVSADVTFPKSTEKPKLENKKVTMKRLSEGRLSDKSNRLKVQQPPKSPSLLRANPDGQMIYPKTLVDYYQCVTQEHVGYLHQIAERAASARRVGNITETTDRLSFSTASPLNAYSHNLLENVRNAKNSNRVFGSSPVSSLNMMVQRNASLHSNPAAFAQRRRVSSMSAGIVNEETNNLLEPQFSTNVLVIDCSIYEGLSKGLAQKYKLIGGSASEICYHNLWAVISEYPDRPDLISLWQILYEFMCASEEKEIQAYLRNEIESDFIGAEILSYDSTTSPVTTELYNRERLQLCALEFMTPDPFANKHGSHPCGREFLATFVEFYYQRHDIQTAAMVICVMNEANKRNNELLQLESPRELKAKRSTSAEREYRSSPERRARTFRKSGKLHYRSSQYCPLFITSEDPEPMDPEAMKEYYDRDAKIRLANLSHIEKSTRKEMVFSSKESKSQDETRSSYDPPTESNLDETREKKEEFVEYPTIMRLEGVEDEDFEVVENDAWMEEKFDKIRDEYDVFLCRWGLLNHRTELNKYALKPEETLLIKQVIKCSKCDRICDDSPICSDCEVPALWCIICDEPCEGHIAICSLCGHGGHPQHLNEWFKNFDQCAALCGCRCSL
ncbi:unnamed protein product [Bursaphelenchus okinawaensis]|uniref:GATOR complex protein WDR24 n=1 Tax=Bursaphelenchus okinawaensis TaxID=465554 RepID=A0A811JZT7_9BILA|nr:unnamed protein product [Bursaphelenchus okinawaensis]CAG9088529.1 unnamed protein product [Bursaphelenchus okinawaensis]